MKAYSYLRSCPVVVLICLQLFAFPASAVTCNIANPDTKDTFEISNPDAAYTDNGDGTVTDKRTALIWQKCSKGQVLREGSCSGTALTYTWSEALQLAKNDSTAQHNDWRLPNLKELRGLVEECRVRPAINDTLFVGTPNEYFWTGSPYIYGAANTWSVGFAFGESYASDRSEKLAVRLVRGAEPSIAPPTATRTLEVKVTTSVSAFGSAGVAVISEPSGISINPGFTTAGKPTTASGSFPVDTTVKLTASSTNSATPFTGWGGACDSYKTNPVCVVTLKENSQVEANFGSSIEKLVIKGGSSLVVGGELKLQAGTVASGKSQDINNASWSLAAPKIGFDLSSSGLLKAQANAAVGPVVVKASYQSVASEFVVNILDKADANTWAVSVEASGPLSSHSLAVQATAPQTISIDQFYVTNGQVGFSQAEATCKSEKSAAYNLASWNDVSSFYALYGANLADLQLDAWLKPDGTTGDYYFSYHYQKLWAATIDKAYVSGPQLKALCITPATYDFYVAAVLPSKELKMLNSTGKWVVIPAVESLQPFMSGKPSDQKLSIFNKEILNAAAFAGASVWLGYAPSGMGPGKLVAAKMIYQLP